MSLFKKTSLAMFILALFGIYSCHEPTSTTGPQVPTGNGTVMGKVTSITNIGIANVEVSIGSQKSLTNSTGDFFLTNVGAGRVKVDFKSDFQASTQKIISVANGKTTYITASMANIGATKTIASSTGGTVTFNAATVKFDPNSIAYSNGTAFSGNATVKATYFDPTNATFTNCFPGEFKGIDKDGKETSIESYGFINVEISSGTEKLNLVKGMTADISLPIPASIVGKAPLSIPLWWYDESFGIWKEEGFAKKSTDGKNYEGKVSHFSNWNCDRPTETSFLHGRILDKNSKPMYFARVMSQGSDYAGSSSAYTDENGNFKIAVKSAASVKITANYYTFASTTQTFTTPPTGDTLDIGDITIDYDETKVSVIVGQVVDNADKGLANAYVNVTDTLGTKTESFAASKDGKFKIICEPGKVYKIKVSNGYRDSVGNFVEQIVTAPPAGETLDLGTIKLDVGGSTIIGRIVDASNNPVTKAYVYSPEGYPNGSTNKEGMIDSITGKFVLTCRPNKTFDITVIIYPNQKSKAFSVTSGALGEIKDVGDLKVD